MQLSRVFLLFVCLFCASNKGIAQADLFGTEKEPQRKGFVFGANGNLDLPGGDMAKRFGLSYRVGPSVLYKTKSNFIFGAKFDFILGGKVKEDSLMKNIRDKDGAFLDNNGQN